MPCNYIFVFVLIPFKSSLADSFNNDLYDSCNVYPKDKYMGEKFPENYMSIDEVQPTASDFSHYVQTLKRVVTYFNKKPNDTDPNVAIGTYYMKVLLKRTLIDDGKKISDKEKNILKNIINKAENIESHFMYVNYPYGWEDKTFRLSQMFKYEDAQIYSIGNFHKGVMKKWIKSNLKLHDDIEQMDDLTLPKEKYAVLVTSMDDYYDIDLSDSCLSRMAFNPLPIKLEEMKSCRPDPECKEKVLLTPSVAYALSHRLFYMLALRQMQRCYIVSEEQDKVHMDIMCANMYRETVYLAKRGYFYRDLFLEHIALCALLGYQEFHRRHWFYKAASWVDEDGCMKENRNFELNRTKIYCSRARDAKRVKELMKLKAMFLLEDCHTHQMALLMTVLAHGIRYAAHYMNTTL